MLDQENSNFKDEADRLAAEWISAWGRSRILQESKKPFLAMLQTEAIQSHNGEKELTAAAAERKALTSPRYREFFKGLVEAEREEKRLCLLYENLKTKWMKS